jgi:hypothetical protein
MGKLTLKREMDAKGANTKPNRCVHLRKGEIYVLVSVL